MFRRLSRADIQMIPRRFEGTGLSPPIPTNSCIPRVAVARKALVMEMKLAALRPPLKPSSPSRNMRAITRVCRSFKRSRKRS